MGETCVLDCVTSSSSSSSGSSEVDYVALHSEQQQQENTTANKNNKDTVDDGRVDDNPQHYTTFQDECNGDDAVEVQHDPQSNGIPRIFGRFPEAALRVHDDTPQPAAPVSPQEPQSSSLSILPTLQDTVPSSQPKQQPSRVTRFMNQINADFALSSSSDQQPALSLPDDHDDGEGDENDKTADKGRQLLVDQLQQQQLPQQQQQLLEQQDDKRSSLGIANPKYAISIRFHHGKSKRSNNRNNRSSQSPPRRSWYCYFCSAGFLRKLYKCASFDTEMEEILRLAIPYLLASLIRDGLEFLEMICISRNLGVTSLAVYFVVDFCLRLSTMILDGGLSSLYVLCSHAVGAQNYTLAGRYVQLAVVGYQILYVPIVWFWYARGSLASVMMWLGLQDQRDGVTTSVTTEAIEIANAFLPFALAHVGVAALDTTLHSLLDIVGLERYSTMLKGVHSICKFFGVAYISLFESAQLWMIGLWHVAMCALFVVINLVIVVYQQWLNQYWHGLLFSFALADFRAVKAFTISSLSLSVRYMIEYCGWEILFIFAAMQGPAEIAVWGLLGSAWDVVGDIANALAGAAKVRVAQLLGSQSTMAARYSAHKTFFLALLLAGVMSLSTYLCRESIPGWLTQDIALKKMLFSLVPLVCVGLLVLPFGTMAWAILCAQGRTALATGMSFLGVLGVTLPLSALFTWLNVNLEGLLSAVIAGHATSGALNFFFTVISDWDKIATTVWKRAQKSRKNKNKGPDEYPSSSSESSSAGNMGNVPNNKDNATSSSLPEIA